MKLKLGIAFSYLNAEKEIPRSLKPWVPQVDHIIAVNGRYWTPQTPEMLKKQYSRFSTDNSYKVLKEVCGDKLSHEDFYGTQMEKRQRTFDIAGELGCDFVIVWDSDDLIYGEPNWDRFHKQIQALAEAWPEQQLFQMEAWIPKLKLWSPQHNEVRPESWVPYTRIHKNPGDMYYCLNHWSWASKKYSREEIYKYVFDNPAINPLDAEQNKYLLKSRMTIDAVKITTDRVLRTRDQLTFGDQWAFQNMHWENFHYLVEAHAHHYGGKFVFEKLKEQKYPNLEYFFDPRAELIPYHIDSNHKIVLHPNASRNIKEIIKEMLKIQNMGKLERELRWLSKKIFVLKWVEQLEMFDYLFGHNANVDRYFQDVEIEPVPQSFTLSPN